MKKCLDCGTPSHDGVAACRECGGKRFEDFDSGVNWSSFLFHVATVLAFLVPSSVAIWTIAALPPNERHVNGWVIVLVGLIGLALTGATFLVAIRLGRAADAAPRTHGQTDYHWTGSEAPDLQYLILSPDDHVERKVLHVVPVSRALRVDDAAGNAHYLIDVVDDEPTAWHFDGPGILAGEPTDTRPRTFPCTRFALEAPLESEGVELRIRCLGPAVEPLVAARQATAEDFEQGWMPWKGEILAKAGFDELCSRFGVSERPNE